MHSVIESASGLNRDHFRAVIIYLSEMPFGARCCLLLTLFVANVVAEYIPFITNEQNTYTVLVEHENPGYDNDDPNELQAFYVESTGVMIASCNNMSNEFYHSALRPGLSTAITIEYTGYPIRTYSISRKGIFLYRDVNYQLISIANSDIDFQDDLTLNQTLLENCLFEVLIKQATITDFNPDVPQDTAILIAVVIPSLLVFIVIFLIVCDKFCAWRHRRHLEREERKVTTHTQQVF